MNIVFKVVKRSLLEDTDSRPDKKAVRVKLRCEELECKTEETEPGCARIVSGRFSNEYYLGRELELLLPAEEYENYPLGSEHTLAPRLYPKV